MNYKDDYDEEINGTHEEVQEAAKVAAPSFPEELTIDKLARQSQVHFLKQAMINTKREYPLQEVNERVKWEDALI